ncbi:MAG: TRAP transporter large permease [Moorellales bacterium]
MLTTTVILLVLLVAVLFSGMPIAFGLGFLSVLGILLFMQPAQLSQLVNIAFTQGTSSTILMIPLFILMAEILGGANIATDLFDTVNRRLRRVRANLAVSSIVASAIFSALCGSSPATAATIGTASIPAMLKKGYKPSFAAGVQAAGGTLGILIPPSIALAVYGIITETSIAKLFMAGLLPGVVLALLLVVFTMIWTKFNPSLLGTAGGSAAGRSALEEDSGGKVGMVRDLATTLPVVTLVILILCFLYFGWATPTEVGAIGAVGALLIGIGQRRLHWDTLSAVFLRTTRTSCMIMFMMFGGLSLVFVISSLGLPQEIAQAIINLSPNRWVTLIAVNVLLLILGCLLEPIGMMVITLPFIFPTLLAQGFDPIWLGVLLTINVEVGMITPPVGLNLFVLRGVSGLSMKDIMSGTLPFVIVLLAAMVMLMFWPELALFLPSTMK